MEDRPNAAKNNVLLPPCRTSVVCETNLEQVYLSLAGFCRSNCCYNVRETLLKPNKYWKQGTDRIVGDSRRKLLIWEGVKPYRKKSNKLEHGSEETRKIS